MRRLLARCHCPLAHAIPNVRSESNTCSLRSKPATTWYPRPVRIEDYALIGDTQTAGLVSTAGSVDWLCLPRFDSDACFAALLGDEGNGRWRIAPAGPVSRVRRRYRPGTL